MSSFSSTDADLLEQARLKAQARLNLEQRYSRFTPDEEEFIFQAAKTQTPTTVGAIPFFDCWKSSVRYSGSVLKCQQTRTSCDIMLTFCVEGHRPVNLIVDSAYNGVGSMHAALVKHFGDALDPDADKFEYSCLVRAVAEVGEVGSAAGSKPVIQEERRTLSPREYNDWLMHGHIIDVAEKPSKAQARKQAVQNIVAAIGKGDLDTAVAQLMTHPTTGKDMSYAESRRMYG